MSERPEETFLQRRYTDEQQTHEKRSPSPTLRAVKSRRLRGPAPTPARAAVVRQSPDSKCWRGRGEEGPSCSVGGSGSRFNHCGEQHGGALENCTWTRHVAQPSHSWAHTQTKLPLKKTHAPVCPPQRYSPQPRPGSNPHVHRQMNG